MRLETTYEPHRSPAPREDPQPRRHPAEAILALQRGAGNQALARLVDERGGREAAGAEPPVAGEAIGDIIEDAKLVLAMAVTAVGLDTLDLAGSVGRGGKNHRRDVARIAVRLAGAGYSPGTTLTELGNAIAHYQAEVVGMSRPDGRVDPGGRTIASLRGPKPAAPKPAAAAPPAVAAAPAGPLVVPGQNADADAAARELAALEAKFKRLKRSARNEEIGEGRDELVAGFASLRAKVERLDPGLRPRFYRAMNAISPYYFQGLNIILEFDRVDKKTGKLVHVWNTCNITSLAMTLEALGKSAADYKYLDLVPPVAEVFKQSVDEKAHDKVGTDLSGLRLPDFVAMAAIIWQMGYKTGDHAAILAGGNKAFNAIPSMKAVATLARDFGAPATENMFTGSWSALSAYGGKHWKQASAQSDARKRKDGTFTDDKIERDIPLQAYKQQVMSRIGPVLDSGKQVVAGQYNHFVRLQSVTDEFVIKDDPGHFLRGDAELTWEQARALGLFWNWIVIG